jgi:hypothetical protein
MYFIYRVTGDKDGVDLTEEEDEKTQQIEDCTSLQDCDLIFPHRRIK